jgi:hypothetical protein
MLLGLMEKIKQLYVLLALVKCQFAITSLNWPIYV